ncbi:hypothetical protein A2Z22_05200, partial [Candidatus Woesebacteria bacterium RBG_16_34_12]
MKVLIIEDEPLVARMYEKALTFEKFEVICAVGGKDGIEEAKKNKPDIILMDIMMPEMNGIEALDIIKSDPVTSDIPVVMLTNLSGIHDMELAKEKGAEDYWVKKDIKPREMGEKIKKI